MKRTPFRVPDTSRAHLVSDSQLGSHSQKEGGMFTNLKKKLAEEGAIAPRPGGAARIPRSISKESITSVGADSGDDFASDGSSSRDDLPSQISRRNDQIRRLEAKLSDYTEQVRHLQRMKEKLELALEKHQDSSMRKFQDQNEMYNASRAKMAEEYSLSLEKKDQEWLLKLAALEEEKRKLSDQVEMMKKQNISLFQKREDLDELEVFQQQEMAKIKHMLLKKEELLSKAEKDLELKCREAETSQAELQDRQCLSDKLKKDLEQLQEENSKLAEQRTELTSAQEGAEKKITELEQRQQELQDFIQRLSLDLQKAQAGASSSEKRLNDVQNEYETLKLQHEQLKSKMAIEAGEKDALIIRLQEKVNLLEKTLEGTFSGEKGLQELLMEKAGLETRLDETRQQLLETRSLHLDRVSQMESQTAKVNSRLQDMQDFLQQKDTEMNQFKDESSLKLRDVQQTLQTVREELHAREKELKQKEEQIASCQSELKSESDKLTHQLHSVRQQCAEKVDRLEAQVSALESAREIDRTSAQHNISLLEQEKESLQERNKDLEAALKKLEADQEKMKEELSSRETVSVEIAKALEETRRQKEDLQQQVADLTAVIDRNTQEISLKKEQLVRKEEEAALLKGDYDAIVLKMQQLQSELETYKTKAAQSEESAEKHVRDVGVQLQEQKEALQASESQVSSLQQEVSTLHERLHGTHTQETNGEVTVGDIAQLQKENREMEQQIAEKNKTIKQLQQRMAELKKTLQKELRLKPEAEEKLNPADPLAPSFTVTNNADLNDSREINFEYLKHVVLKFMSAREAEAFHLIKAVSVLLNFSVEEENLLKETLEYKMSWFGSKPAPKGSVRPSVSKPRTLWS
ncbi:golgin subfamily A member 1 isoform X1 [Bufo gargarizans]|uniref:golgin subfamily A member 1 isoform X1 n=1 Tax=Bufo gargarizans TaxID=30331 RepID=UPI001CF228F4|nr:golgin subfamily A member 1 isoform X1 [Bufo gargarizans]